MAYLDETGLKEVWRKIKERTMNVSFNDRLGSTITSEQLDDIKNGKFQICHCGAYWNINNYRWYIVAINPFWYIGGDQKGGTSGLLKQHVVVWVNRNIDVDDQKWNASQDISKGYADSKIRSKLSGLIPDAFKPYIITHDEVCWKTNNTFDLIKCTVELPSGKMIGFGGIGDNFYRQASNSAGPSFETNYLNFGGGNFWTRDIVSDKEILAVYNNSNCYPCTADAPWNGVRPYFLMGGEKQQ